MTGLTLHVRTCPTRTLRDGKNTFSPTTATLVAGSREAVLVDTHYLREDVDALADQIERSGRKLTSIFITHGHYDHYYGLGVLRERFPDARAVAAPNVALRIEQTAETDAKLFGAFFAELSAPPTVLPDALTSDRLTVDGSELPVIDLRQGDVSPTTALHIPPLDAVIAGDVIYNDIHSMLAFGGPPQWQAWLDSITTIEALQPRTIVAGHKKPESTYDTAPAIISANRRYLTDFITAVSDGLTATGIIEAMSAKWPNHGNLSTLRASAFAAAAAS